jgi:hypothetical protein
MSSMLRWQLVRGYMTMHFLSNLCVALGATNILLRNSSSTYPIWGGIVLVASGVCFFVAGSVLGTVSDDLKHLGMYSPAGAQDKLTPSKAVASVSMAILATVSAVAGICISRL